MPRFVQLQQVGPGLFRAKAILEGGVVRAPENVVLVEAPKDVSNNEILGSLYLNGEWLGKNTKGSFQNYDAEIKASIIIPTFSGGDKLDVCLKTFILHHKNALDYEIIVVIDGGPHKEAIKKITSKYGVLTIVLDRNAGFSAAVNAGLREVRAQSECVILVNDDIRFFMPSCLVLANALRQNTDTAIVGSLLFYPDGKVQHAGVTSDFKHRLHGQEATDEAFVDREEWGVTGALFGISLKYLEQCGRFDERYKLAWEDSDFCAQAHLLGWKVRYCGSAAAYHEEGGTRGRTPETKKEKPEWLTRDMEGRVAFSKKWGTEDPSLRLKKIIVCRNGAAGDVLLTTPLVRELRRKNPEAVISIATDFGRIFRDNPYVSFVLPPEHPWIKNKFYDEFYDLNLSYEKNPRKHIIQAYGEACDVKIQDWKLDLYLRRGDEEFAKKLMGNGQWVVLHSHFYGWPGREWSSDNFNKLSERIREYGKRVVLVGSNSGPHIKSDLDLRGKTSFHELAAVIKNSTCFVGIDSLPMHIAQAFEIPSVALFGSINPDFRLIPNGRVRPVMASPDSVKCLGCHHRHKTPQTSGNCVRKHPYCMEEITPSMVFSAFKKLFK